MLQIKVVNRYECSMFDTCYVTSQLLAFSKTQIFFFLPVSLYIETREWALGTQNKE